MTIFGTTCILCEGIYVVTKLMNLNMQYYVMYVTHTHVTHVCLLASFLNNNNHWFQQFYLPWILVTAALK